VTDRHCVPPTVAIRTPKPVSFSLRSVQAKFAAQVKEKVNEFTGLPFLRILSRDDEIATEIPLFPQIDPLNGRIWPRGKTNTDLAIIDSNPLKNHSYLLPAAFDDRELLEKEVPVCFIGYPQRLQFPQFELLWRRVNNLRQLPIYTGVFVEEQELMQREYVSKSLEAAFHQFEPKILSLGSTIKKSSWIRPRDNVLVAVTNSSTTCTSGSPYFLPSNPRFVIGQHLGSGVYSHLDDAEAPNYNLMMTVNNQEWVYRWVKYIYPQLPASDHDAVSPYINKHKAFLKEVGLFPSGF